MASLSLVQIIVVVIMGFVGYKLVSWLIDKARTNPSGFKLLEDGPEEKYVFEEITNYLFSAMKVYIVVGGKEKKTAALTALCKLENQQIEEIIFFATSYFFPMIREMLTQYEGDKEELQLVIERVSDLEKEIQSAVILPGSEKARNLLIELSELDPSAKKALEGLNGQYFVKNYPQILGAETDRVWFNLMKQFKG